MKPIVIAYLLITTSLLTAQETKIVEVQFHGSSQVSESYSVLKSDGVTRHGPYISYFVAPKEDIKRIKKIKSNFFAFTKEKGGYINGKREGEWIVYSSPGTILSQGSYRDDKQSGIWMILREEGQVTERYDHDLGKQLSPLISVKVSYPAVSRKAGTQGIVTVGYTIHPDCSVTDIKILKSVSPECDQVVLDAYEKLAGYYRKYAVDCVEKTETRDIRFALND